MYTPEDYQKIVDAHRSRCVSETMEEMGKLILTDQVHHGTISPYNMSDKEFKEMERREKEKKILRDRRRNQR